MIFGLLLKKKTKTKQRWHWNYKSKYKDYSVLPLFAGTGLGSGFETSSANEIIPNNVLYANVMCHNVLCNFIWNIWYAVPVLAWAPFTLSFGALTSKNKKQTKKNNSCMLMGIKSPHYSVEEYETNKTYEVKESHLSS